MFFWKPNLLPIVDADFPWTSNWPVGRGLFVNDGRMQRDREGTEDKWQLIAVGCARTVSLGVKADRQGPTDMVVIGPWLMDTRACGIINFI
jgi:hypothetical protein